MKDSSLEQRYWSKVNRAGPDDCWLWIAAVSTEGYGEFWVGGKLEKASRVAWSRTNGPIPAGLFVLHSCDSRYSPSDFTYRKCCNPAHLFLGTNQDNMDDMVKKGRSAKGKRNGSKTHPDRLPRGQRNGAHVHPERVVRGERNRFAKLTEVDVLEIRAVYAKGGISTRALAERFNVHQVTVSCIVRRKTWRHI